MGAMGVIIKITLTVLGYTSGFCEFETLKLKYMMQVIEMTHSKKVEMYQMVEKDELIEMLIEANNVINRLTEAKNLRIADVSNLNVI
jgi:hypothetical protein